MTGFTSSGARRTGDDYQDFQSAETFVDWLEHPEKYSWVRLETMDGSLDDIQVGLPDKTGIFLQVKFGVDELNEWDWKALTKREKGAKGPKISLLQKWKKSVDDLRAKSPGLGIREAALLTNRGGCDEIVSYLSASGIVNFDALPADRRTELEEHLGGAIPAKDFFSVFKFRFNQPSFDALESGLQMRFARIGGTEAGWFNLLRSVKRWINRKNEPAPDGTISLEHIRAAALWNLPPQIPQNFNIPPDYVPPQRWSLDFVEPSFSAGSIKSVAVVTGSPGAGKSTYLSWLVRKLELQGQPVVRHHYFLSMTDSTSFRSDWETAANSLISQLISNWPELNLSELANNPSPRLLARLLATAGARRLGEAPLVVVVDGLDHVWRDTNDETELRQFFDLILPVPPGVFLIVGTQNVDSSRLPLKLRTLCPVQDWHSLPRLDLVGVGDWLGYHRGALQLGDVPRSGDDWLFSELRQAFFDVTAGHPLILHYALNSVASTGRVPSPETVRALPWIDASAPINSYYQQLWDSISPVGHTLLHLLAGFSWSWPRTGLVQCLSPQANTVDLETAEKAVRHLLGYSHSGIGAFHESLLAFVRTRSEHGDTVETLRPLVLAWLSDRAPSYWRWRHEWEQQSRNGDSSSLIALPDVDWCVEAIISGRPMSEISKILGLSGYESLRAGKLGVATERNYIDSYLHQGSYEKETVASLIGLAFLKLDRKSVELELNLFLGRVNEATEEELLSVCEAAFFLGHIEVCWHLNEECWRRWNLLVETSDVHRKLPVLQECGPGILASLLDTENESEVRRFFLENQSFPSWSTGERYVKSLGRMLGIGNHTAGIRDELKFFANAGTAVSFVAVDEIVRLACQEGFNPGTWITATASRSSELLQCYLNLVCGQSLVDEPSVRKLSFASCRALEYGEDEIHFSDLARAYFFNCLAYALRGTVTVGPIDVEPKAVLVAEFLEILRDLAGLAGSAAASGNLPSGRWFLASLAELVPPKPRNNDLSNRFARAGQLARTVVSIAQDLENFYFARTECSSLAPDVLTLAIDLGWTTGKSWMLERVRRHLPFRLPETSVFLIEREKNRLACGKDFLSERASDYSLLARFLWLHGGGDDLVRAMSQLAARNLLGHGYRKDVVLFDQIEAIQIECRGSSGKCQERLEFLSPIIQIIDELTDGSETRHLKGELAEVLIDLAPQSVPPYLRRLQLQQHHQDVEFAFTRLFETLQLESPFECALAETIVHSEALAALGKRRGGFQAGSSVMARLELHSGAKMANATPESAAPAQSSDVDKVLPAIADYPPTLLEDFKRAFRDSGAYGDEYLGEWSLYWSSREPAQLLDAVSRHYEVHGRVHERKTGKLITELAGERLGKASAWKWLVAYHRESLGWVRYFSDLSKIEWIWDFVRLHFPTRWLDFIKETSAPTWSRLEGPSWSVSRLVLFLEKFGQSRAVSEVIDASLDWARRLSADVLLPTAALTPDRPGVPTALRLLVDRLDCPSRMVQERALSMIAKLLATDAHRTSTFQAIQDWHSFDLTEMRSCTVLLCLHIASKIYGLEVATCLSIIRQMDIVPSIGAFRLLSDFGPGGVALAQTLEYGKGHSGKPNSKFWSDKEFDDLVGAHLAPLFRTWASRFDKQGADFTEQWKWEAGLLMKSKDLSLNPEAHYDQHYRGQRGGAVLPINDRVSAVLRSSYLRAMQASFSDLHLPARYFDVRKVSVLLDVDLLFDMPGAAPTWWPEPMDGVESTDNLLAQVQAALTSHFDKAAQARPDSTTLFAAGPVTRGNGWTTELKVTAFLQSSSGPLKPFAEQFSELELPAYGWIRDDRPNPGAYTEVNAPATYQLRDWFVTPLSGVLWKDTFDWLRPDYQLRDVQVPARWLVPGVPRVVRSQSLLEYEANDQIFGQFSFWHLDLFERYHPRHFSRVGGQLTVKTAILEPYLKAGGSICWLATLSRARRKEDESEFGESSEVGAWIFGGSRLVLGEPLAVHRRAVDPGGS